MDVFKIYVNDRNYSSWNIFETANFQPVDLDINPAENKLFSNDVFSVDDAKNVKLIHSSIRSVFNTRKFFTNRVNKIFM